MMRTRLTLAILAACAVWTVGCGEQGQPDQDSGVRITSVQPVSPEETQQGWRRDALRGEGGFFEFTLSEQTFSSRWGYADFSSGETASGRPIGELYLQNSVAKKEELPRLQITLWKRRAQVADFASQTINSRKLNLHIAGDGGEVAYDGEVEVRINSIEGDFVSGSFSGFAWLQGAEQPERLPLGGAFRARLHILQ